MSNPNRPQKTQQPQRTNRDPRKQDYYELSPVMQSQGMKGKNEGSLMLKNGHSKTNGGYRAVVLTPTGTVRPVQRMTRNGYVPDRGTWQLCHSGDLIFHVSRNPKSMRLGTMDQKVYTYDKEGGIKEFTDYSQLKAKWDLVPADLSDWLDEHNSKDECILPAPHGWDGDKSLEESQKESRIRTMLRGIRPDVIEEVIREAMLSNSQGLPTNWRMADPRIPADLDNPVEVVAVEADALIDRHVIWVLQCTGNRVSLRDPEPTSGTTTKGAGDTQQVIVHTNKARAMPKEALRAMRISFGHYTKDGKSYGVSWKLFAKAPTKRPHHPPRNNKVSAKEVVVAVAAEATNETFALDA